MRDGYYNATIVFETGTGGENHYRSYTKLFSGLRHLNNYIDVVMRERGWMLDELFINDGFPFKEGETYYTIEKAMSDGEYNLLVSNGENPQRYEVVRSCWDDVSEEMYDKRTQYFDSYQRANEYLKIISDQ